MSVSVAQGVFSYKIVCYSPVFLTRSCNEVFVTKRCPLRCVVLIHVSIRNHKVHKRILVLLMLSLTKSHQS